MMRKYAYPLLFAALLACAALATACLRDPLDSAGSADGPVTLRVGVSIPEVLSVPTRAAENDLLGDAVDELSEGNLKNLKIYLFVFEDTGSRASNYLRTLVYGDQIVDGETVIEEDPGHAPSPDAKHYLRNFRATVDGTSENAIIHIVATSDPDFEKQLTSTSERSELGLFSGATGLFTSGRYPAYWKRIKLGCPLNEANKTTIQEALSHVKLVRNFARVTVRCSDRAEDLSGLQGFVLDGFVLVNVVDCGYVAPFSASGTVGFVDFEKDGSPLSYDDIVTGEDGKQYTGVRHPNSSRIHKEEATASWLENDTPKGGWNAPGASAYLFERPYQSQHKTYVLVKGHFSNAAPRYIKLDIGTVPDWEYDDQGNRYGVFETRHLLRNFSYDITITRVSGQSVGDKSAIGALDGPPANNVSTAVETRNLLRISDNDDCMQVNFTTLVVVDDDAGNPVPATYDLKWRYWEHYLPGNNRTEIGNRIRWDYPGYPFAFENGVDPDGIIASWSGDDTHQNQTTTPEITWTDGKETGPWATIATTSTDSDKDDPWRGFTLHFANPTDVQRQKTIRLFMPVGDNEKERFCRDVTIIMRKRWEFVNNSPDIYESYVEVYPGVYSYEDDTLPYESLDEMRKNVTPGYVGSQRGAQLTVMFELPADLPEAIFPLDFRIGFDRQNVESAYVGNATIVSGPSMFEDDPGGVGVQRNQFIKTVTWDYYNGSGDSKDKGHKIVTVRFLTTNDVLDESGFDDVLATTRVRVDNKYFKLGEDKFERAAHEDVVDPTRTLWYWNFTYPEWTTYFSTYYQKPNDPYTLNNLHFRGYQKVTNGSSGNYLLLGETVSGAEDGTTSVKSAFYFPVDLVYSENQNYELTIRAQANQGRSARQGSGSSAYFYLYDRDVYAAVVVDDGTEDGKVIMMKCKDGPSGTYNQVYTVPPGDAAPGDHLFKGKQYVHGNVNQTGSGNNAGSPKNPEDFTFQLKSDNEDWKIVSGDKIKEIRIWSMIDCDANQENNRYRLQSSATRYYSIKFELTPKP